MKRIKKIDIKTILDAYAVRPDEFVQVTENSYMFKSRFAKGYHITLEVDPDHRILVHHSSRSGKRTHTDVWEQTNDGLQWLYRNAPDIPLSDREAIISMQKEIEILKAAGRRLQEELRELKQPEEDYQKLSRKRGRPKETARIDQMVRQIEACIQAGYKNTQIMEQLHLSKPTYYRYKKRLWYLYGHA